MFVETCLLPRPACCSSVAEQISLPVVFAVSDRLLLQVTETCQDFLPPSPPPKKSSRWRTRGGLRGLLVAWTSPLTLFSPISIHPHGWLLECVFFFLATWAQRLLVFRSVLPWAVCLHQRKVRCVRILHRQPRTGRKTSTRQEAEPRHGTWKTSGLEFDDVRKPTGTREGGRRKGHTKVYRGMRNRAV